MGWGQVAPVEISEVEFDQVAPAGAREAWYEVAIEVRGQAREAERRAEPLRLSLELAFARAGGSYAFYRTSVQFLAPSAGDEVVVYCYLPPGIIERDGIRGDPFGWRVSLAQGERVYPQAPGSYSDSLRTPEAARSFAQRLATEAEENDGWLQPIYLTPFYQRENGRLDRSPSYLRKEPLATGGLR